MPLETIKGTTALSLVGLTYEFSDTIRAKQTYRGSMTAALAGALVKGTAGSGTLAGYIVERSIPQHRGDEADAELVIDWVWNPANVDPPPQGEALPADSARIQKTQLDIALEHLPRYAPPALTGETHAQIRAYVGNPIEYEPDFTAYLIENPTQMDLAGELADKLIRGNTHKRVWAPVYIWTRHYWAPPALSGGGMVVSAIGGPITEPAGFEWLRSPDEPTWNGAHWEVVSEWTGAPTADGGWDAQLYPHS